MHLFGDRFCVHERARGPHPAYPTRAEVPPDKVAWNVEYPEYSPGHEFTHDAVLTNMLAFAAGAKGRWADETNNLLTAFRNTEHSGVAQPHYKLCVDEDGRPLNPRGRTGLRGRGLLGKWGANRAADPIVTRFKPGSNKRTLQFVGIRRKDTNEYALPGGMVEDGEDVSQTLLNEFNEEALGIIEGNTRIDGSVKARLVDLFKNNGEVVYVGYVDDPRNTDHAWMETVAKHLHCSDELAADLPLQAGDDAAPGSAAWIDITPDLDLYASHKYIVEKAAWRMTWRGTAVRALATNRFYVAWVLPVSIAVLIHLKLTLK
jgi:ADP-ribose pyrophosphatase